MREDVGRKKSKLKCELYNDSMQSWKCYPIQKAQLIIADVPYNVGNNFYGSNPMWYVDGDNKNGESKLAGKAAFASDFNFNLYEYFHFCSRLMKKDDKKPSGRGRSTDSPCRTNCRRIWTAEKRRQRFPRREQAHHFPGHRQRQLSSSPCLVRALQQAAK